MMDKQKPSTEVVTVLGQRGSGKTSWVKSRLSFFPRFVLWDTLSEYEGYPIATNLNELYGELSKNEQGPVQVVYRSLSENDVDDLNIMCQMVMALGDCVLIVEEVDTYATPSVIPYDLKRLLKIGRHYGISMIFVSRRPAEINRLITSQSQRFVCFRIIEPNDIRYLRSIIGEPAGELPGLPVLSYLDWRHGEVVRGQITF